MPPSPPTPATRRSIFQPVLIVLATFLAFGALLSADFVQWDDYETVAKNPRLNPPSAAGLAHHWVHPHMDLYVPVTYTFWSALGTLARTSTPDPAGIYLNPAIFHAANLLLHAVNTLLVWSILTRLTKLSWPATIGALLFALHPVQVEPVAWVSGTKDLLAGFFTLLAVHQYLRPGRLHHTLALLAYALATLSKPAAITAPLILLAIDYWLLRHPLRQSVISLAPWLVVAVPIAVVTKMVQPTPETFTAPLWARPLIAADALAAYVWHLLIPLHQSIDYGRSPAWFLASTAKFWTWVIPAAIAVLCWRFRRSRPWLLAGIVITVAALLPVLGLVKFDFQRHSTVADHYLYVSMFGLALIIAAAAGGPRRLAAASVVLALLGGKTMSQTLVWRDSESLFSHAVAVNPTSLAGRNGLGSLALDAGRYGDAIAHFEAARAAHGHDAITNYNLGNALLLAGRAREAVAPYRVAIDGGKRYPFMYVNLAGALARAGDLDTALAVSEEGLAHFPASAELEYTLGTVLMFRKDYAGAEAAYQAALRINPSLAAAREGLAELQRIRGK